MPTLVIEFFNDNIAIALLFYRPSSDRIHKNTTGDRTTNSMIAFLAYFIVLAAIAFTKTQQAIALNQQQ
jgi:uncharacterized membrane protein